MSSDPRQFVVRRPRHLATSAACRVWVERRVWEPLPRLAAELSDFSRQGARLELPRPLEQGEAFVLRIGHAESEFSVALPAVVRWQRVSGNTWQVGCVFADEVPYEVIGELFLAGILETD